MLVEIMHTPPHRFPRRGMNVGRNNSDYSQESPSGDIWVEKQRPNPKKALRATYGQVKQPFFVKTNIFCKFTGGKNH